MADNASNGIVVQAFGSGAVTAVFNRVEVNNNFRNGIEWLGQISNGTLSATVSDSVAARNGGAGFFAASSSGSALTTLMLFHSVAANNGVGLLAQGAGATLRAAQSMVTGNASGWSISGGLTPGVIQSYGDNYIDGNGSNEGAPPSTAKK